MTLSSLETASFWFNIAVVVLTVLAATAGVFALYFSTRLGALKNRDLDRFKSESATHIASANEQAAEANERAAKAEENLGNANARAALAEQHAAEANKTAESFRLDIAQANERAGKLEIEGQKQREKAAKAERDLLDLQQRLAWRVITPEQEAILVSMLSKFKGQKISIFPMVGSEEIDRFANQLRTALARAGIDAAWTPGQLFGGAKSGISLSIGENRLSFANALAAALVAAKLATQRINADKSGDPNELTVYVWPKAQ